LNEEDEQEKLSEEEAQMEVNTINSLMRFMNIKGIDYNRLVENIVEAQSLSESTLELIFKNLSHFCYEKKLIRGYAKKVLFHKLY
jgi:hypothetical protein